MNMSGQFWRMNVLTEKSRSIVPGDLRYFVENFSGQRMLDRWKGPPPWTTVGKSKTFKDFVAWHTAAPLVSERVKDSISDLFPDISVEYLPFSLLNRYAYYALNVYKVFDCLDLERSEIFLSHSEGEGTPIKIVLNRSRTPNDHIFQIKGIMGHIFVSDVFASAVLSQGFTGVGFTRLDTDVLSATISGKVLNEKTL